MKHRWFRWVALAALLALFSLTAFAEDDVPDDTPSAGFADIETHWARESILRAQELGLVNGMTETEFAPNRSMTRAMFVTVLYRLSGAPGELSESTVFADVSGSAWYADAVRWASANGIVNGVDATHFAPGEPCTRQQAVTLLLRYWLHLGNTAGERSYLAYADAWQLADYARAPMQWAVAAGLIQGTSPDTLSAKAQITRAQFAVLAVRFTDFLDGRLPAPEPVPRPEPPSPCATELFVGNQSGGACALRGSVYYVSPRQLEEAFGGKLLEERDNGGVRNLSLQLFRTTLRFADGFADVRVGDKSRNLGAPALFDGSGWQLPADLFSVGFGRLALTDRTLNRRLYLTHGGSALTLRVNGKPLPRVIAIEGMDYLSLTQLASALGGRLSATGWDGASTVTLTAGGHTLAVHNGSVAVLLDGASLQLPLPAFYDSVTWYLPARAALEALGFTVLQNDDAHTMDCGTLQKLSTVLWIDGKRHSACYSLLGTVYVPLSELCTRCGGTLTEENGAIRLSVFGHECVLAEGSAELKLDGVSKTMGAAVLRTAEGLLAPVKPLVEALGFTELADSSWNQLFYTKIVKNSEIPKGCAVPVLMYHAVSDELWGIPELFVSPKNMEAQLKAMLDAGCTPITFEDLEHVDKIKKPVLLTFDDGYRDNYTNLFPLLKKYNVKATIFMITGSIGSARSLTEEQIREMSDSGLVSFQSHTVSHNYLDEMSAAQLESEMRDSLWRLTRLTGKQPFVLCYPTGRSNALARQIAAKYYEYGLNMGGSRYVTGSNPYMIYRYYVSRDTSLSTFLSYVR